MVTSKLVGVVSALLSSMQIML